MSVERNVPQGAVWRGASTATFLVSFVTIQVHLLSLFCVNVTCNDTNETNCCLQQFFP